MKFITKHDAYMMIKGSSILSCGGGLPYKEQIKYLKKINFKKGINIIDINDITNKNGVFVTVSELGPSDDPPIDKSRIKMMIDIFEKNFKQKILGLIPIEIGQETIIFDAAIQSNLPIVNTDLAGLRAVPKANMNALIAQGIKFTRTPAVILTKTGKILVLNKNETIEEDEKKFRNISKKSDSVIFIIGGLINLKLLKKYLNYSSMTLIKKIGDNLIKNKGLKNFPFRLLFKTKAKIIQIDKIKIKGFLKKQIILKSTHNLLKLNVQNEFIELTNEKNIHYTFPKLIIVTDLLNKRGLSSNELKIGSCINLFVFNPINFWSDFKFNYNL